MATPTVTLFVSQFAVLLTSLINLNNIDESVADDANIRSLLLTENGIVERSTEYNIGYRMGLYKPTDEYDENNSSRSLPEDEERVLSPIAGAKISIFSDPYRIEAYDDRVGVGEDRFYTIGMDAEIRVLYVCYTMRNEANVTRLISARKAESYERQLYERQRQW